eukprot:9926191-Alexandrium_andersonii.AAC.1
MDRTPHNQIASSACSQGPCNSSCLQCACNILAMLTHLPNPRAGSGARLQPGCNLLQESSASHKDGASMMVAYAMQLQGGC